MMNIQRRMIGIILVLVMINVQDALGDCFCESTSYFLGHGIPAANAHVAFHAGDGTHFYCYYDANINNTAPFVIVGPNTLIPNAPNCAARFNSNPGRLGCCDCCCGVSSTDFIYVPSSEPFISVDQANCVRPTPGGD